ncbi:hypothetical protein MXD63_41460, partial [Frankia sp. Cpl3]|nr:hypothetical protein [Frankia sp. Cpl3]
MELQPYSYVLLMAATLSSVLGGFILCLRKSWSEEALYAMISAGAGLLLSITILDLVPHSIGNHGHSLMPFVLLGFALLFVMEMISQKNARLGGGNLVGAY